MQQLKYFFMVFAVAGLAACNKNSSSGSSGGGSASGGSTSAFNQRAQVCDRVRDEMRYTHYSAEYEIRDRANGCTTNVVTVDGYNPNKVCNKLCETLKDDAFNRNCARAGREQMYQERCVTGLVQENQIWLSQDTNQESNIKFASDIPLEKPSERSIDI